MFLVLAMVRARLGRFLVTTALAVAAIGAAVSAPVFLAAADRSLIHTELAAAQPSELAVRYTSTVTVTSAGPDPVFAQLYAALPRPTAFQLVDGVEFTASFTALSGPAAVAGAAPLGVTARLAFRELACQHLTLLSGRCPVGGGEVIIGEQTARYLGTGVGGALGEQENVPTPDGPAALGPAATLSIVGVYRPVAPTGVYWAGQQYFAPAASPGRYPEPLFTVLPTINMLTHHHETQSAEQLLRPDAVRADQLPALRAAVTAMVRPAGTGSGTISVASLVPQLLDRIDRDRQSLRSGVPVAALPLVVLAWLGLYLAVSSTAEARRDEIGLVKLRGLTAARRWSLALAESVLAVLVAAPIAYLLGFALVGAVTRLLLPDAPAVGVSGGALLPAGLALLGALASVVLAQRGVFAAPVVELLRRVRARTTGWRGTAVQAVAVTLAVVAVIQLRISGQLTGVSAAAAGLVLLAVAVLGARLAAPAMRLLGRWSLRHGRLGTGLGGLSLARRPGAATVLVVLVLAMGQLGFTVAAANVADATLARQTRVRLGAEQVVSVLPVPPSKLLAAVRAADPTGRYAMATALLAAHGTEPPLLAVDTTRLAAVATWLPEFGPVDAATAARDLRPATAPSIRIQGFQLAVDATVKSFDASRQPHLVAFVQPLAGGVALPVDLGALQLGRHTYSGTAATCTDGCRLAGLHWQVGPPPARNADAGGGVGSFALVIHGINGAGADAFAGWRAPLERETAAAPQVGTATDGFTVQVTDAGLGTDPRLIPGDLAYPVPAITSIRLPPSVFLSDLAGTPQPVRQVGLDQVLPGVGTGAVLVDLETADRVVGASGLEVQAQRPQVWVAAGAPADLVDKLGAAGLTVTGTVSTADELRYQHRQGPGLALRYHYLAALLALLAAVGVLILQATVGRADFDTAQLRTQGVPARVLRRAGRTATLLPVLAALVLGPVAAAVAWVLTGALLPISVDAHPLVAAEQWPTLATGLLIVPATGILLVAAALLTAYGLGRPPSSRPPGRTDPLAADPRVQEATHDRARRCLPPSGAHLPCRSW